MNNINTQYSFFILEHSPEFSHYNNGNAVLKLQHVNYTRSFESEEAAMIALNNDKDMLFKPLVLLPVIMRKL